MQELIDKWEDLKKALNHAKAVPSAKVEEPVDTSMAEPHPDHMPKIKYGKDESDSIGSNLKDHLGLVKVGGKQYVVRHGAAAHRTDNEHQMSKLLGADHMVPDQRYDHGLNHPEHHGKETYNPHEHGGTSFQEAVKGHDIFDALEDPKLTNKLRDQWKNGDLHKLWALHYISNNSDMHPGNFQVTKDGVKAFDSDHAFHELPTAHIVDNVDGPGSDQIKYSKYAQSQLPSYLHPFVDRENDDGIDPKHSDDQVAVKQLNEHAKNIDPSLFEKFGPHAAERAMKAKRALMSSDPTGEMTKLWDDHSDKTGDLNWDKENKKAKQAA